ncbi:hypothetical protein WK54_19920 [Burkholderia ubonensis]|nr:hypothetical protein WK54_19920 [Burkholderia ubonensis]
MFGGTRRYNSRLDSVERSDRPQQRGGFFSRRGNPTTHDLQGVAPGEQTSALVQAIKHRQRASFDHHHVRCLSPPSPLSGLRASRTDQSAILVGNKAVFMR